MSPTVWKLNRYTRIFSLRLRTVRVLRHHLLLPVLIAMLLSAGQACVCGQQAQLPDAPEPQAAPAAPEPVVHHTSTRPVIEYTSNGTPCEAGHHGIQVSSGSVPAEPQENPYLPPCPHHKIPQTSERFTVGTQAQHLTVKDKARMAGRDLEDPYDAMSVAGDSAISVASDPHSVYGPGMHGFGYDTGVGLGQDATNEVVNVFLIPSLTHQDPQYHREPNASVKKRIEHTVVQTAWTESDSGKGMPNYTNLLGEAADDEIGNFYVPGERRGLVANAERYGVGLGMTPVDHLITEFSPDIASHVHVKSVFWQSIIDKVAGVGSVAGPVPAARKHGPKQPAQRPKGRH